MNWVDLAILMAVALAAIHGLRLGAVVQITSFGGFWAGLFIGASLTPHLLRSVSSQDTKFAIAVVVMFGLAAVLGGIGRYLGTRGSSVVHRLKFGSLDSVLGVALAVIATLLAAWLVSNLLVYSKFTGFNAEIQGSRVLRAVDAVLPPPPSVFSRMESFLSEKGVPIVFNGVPPTSAGPVANPTADEVNAAVAAAHASTVRIEGNGCGATLEGSGFVVAPGEVLTNAHVVAGIRSPQVIDQSSDDRLARVVLFDPELDIALLSVPGLGAPALPLDPGLAQRGAVGAALGFPEGGPFDVQPAAVLSAVKASGYDIYGQRQTVREIYEVQSWIRPGNSGGPLVEPDGQVIGVVFARSTSNSDLGYALASPAIISEIAPVQPLSASVSTGECAG